MNLPMIENSYTLLQNERLKIEIRCSSALKLNDPLKVIVFQIDWSNL